MWSCTSLLSMSVHNSKLSDLKSKWSEIWTVTKWTMNSFVHTLEEAQYSVWHFTKIAWRWTISPLNQTRCVFGPSIFAPTGSKTTVSFQSLCVRLMLPCISPPLQLFQTRGLRSICARLLFFPAHRCTTQQLLTAYGRLIETETRH